MPRHRYAGLMTDDPTFQFRGPLLVRAAGNWANVLAEFERPSRVADAYQRLALAMVDDCLDILRKAQKAVNPSADLKWKVKEILSYISEGDPEYPLSFDRQCELIGLNSSAARKALLALVKA